MANVNKATKGLLLLVLGASVATGVMAPAMAANDAPQSVITAAQKETINLDQKALTDAVKRAQDAGLKVTQDATKTYDVTPEKVLSTVYQIKKEQTAKASEIDAKIQEWYKTQSDYKAKKDTYDKAKAQYDIDKAAYDKAVADQSTDQAAYEQALAQYEKDKAAYDQAKAKYDSDKAAYDQKKAAYDEAVAQQESSDHNTAIRVDGLVYENPFDFAQNRASLAELTVNNAQDLGTPPANPYDTGDMYNSDYIRLFNVNNGTTAHMLYKGIATDKETGATLDAVVEVTGMTVSQTPTQNVLGGTQADSQLMVFSNYLDLVAMKDIVKMDIKTTLKYASGDKAGQDYDRNYYISYGSLHGVTSQFVTNATGQNPWPDGGTGHYEYASPVSGVLASLQNPGSLLVQQAQDINSASGVLGKGFMIQQGTDYRESNIDFPRDGGNFGYIGDTDPEIMTRLGVTFKVSNGNTIAIGTSSAVPGQDPTSYYGRYNHAMFSNVTVAPTMEQPPTPPTPPTEPKAPTPPTRDNLTPPTPPTPPSPVTPPAVSYNLANLVTEAPETVKEALDNDKTVLAGMTTHQKITAGTGFQKLNQFVIADQIFKVDGRMVVSVDLSKITVTDGSGKDVTDLFDITEVDGKDIYEIVATAKDPASLPQNTYYALNVQQTALEDGTADKQTDKGYSITNGKRIETQPFTYNEYVPTPEKVVKTDQGVDANNKTVLPSERLVYEVTIDADKLNNTVEAVTELGVEDDYDETYFQPAHEELQILDAQGNDVTDQWDVTWNAEGGIVSAFAKDPANVVGQDYTLRIPGTVSPDAKPGEFSNTAVQIVNGSKVKTNTVKNIVPSMDPHKYDTSPVDGSNIDGKTVVAGDTIQYVLTMDSTELVNTANEVTKFGMRDDYDQDKGQVKLEDARIYKVPGDSDTANLQTVMDLVNLGAEDVTNLFNITDDGDNAFFMMKVDADGKLVDELGNKYIVTLPYEVTANSDDTIYNTAYQVVNDNEFETETVANILKKIEPTKDVVVSVENQDSIDGATIQLGETFNYELNSSTRPAEYGGDTSSWSISDDYDEVHDRYDGNFLVQAKHSFVLEDGTTVEAGADITNYFTQEIDTQTGKVVYTANQEFLDIMNLEANKATEQGWAVYMQVTRIASGDVENTFVENYNGKDIQSNTVITHTPEPPAPAPEDPADPGTPVAKQVANTGAAVLGGTLALAGIAGTGAYVARKPRVKD